MGAIDLRSRAFATGVEDHALVQTRATRRIWMVSRCGDAACAVGRSDPAPPMIGTRENVLSDVWTFEMTDFTWRLAGIVAKPTRWMSAAMYVRFRATRAGRAQPHLFGHFGEGLPGRRPSV